jgi:hypothetical protein
MKKMLLIAAALFAASAEVNAGGCQGPWCQGRGHGSAGPAFQAAPWYMYWPYNAHFQMPAPLVGAYYAPPGVGGMMQSPYFPAPGANR